MEPKKIFFTALFLASPAFATAAEAAPATVLETDFNVSYGQLSDRIAAPLNDAIGAIVRNERCEQVGPRQYRCGELPIGRILNDTTKELFVIPLKNFSGSSDGVEYNLRGRDISVYMSRGQRRGYLTLKLLDTVREEELHTSARLGDDLLLGLHPHGNGELGLYQCLNVPGARLEAENADLNGNLTKRTPWWLPDIHARLHVKIDTGFMRFDNAKLCAELKAKMDSRGLPRLTLEKLGKLQLLGLTHDGLRVTANADVGGFWGFLNGFLRLFGYDIERIIADKVRAEATKAAKEQVDIQVADVKSGRWFAKYLDKGHISRLVRELSDDLRKRLQDQGFGKTEIETAVQAYCLAQAAGVNLPPAQKKALFRLCSLAPKVHLELFARSPAFAAKGCYSHYFDPRRSEERGQAKWWRSGCALVNHVKLTVPGALGPVYSCLVDTWQSRQPPSALCRSVFEDFVENLLAGKLDDIVAKLPPPGKVPSAEELELLRKLAKEQLGVTLPSVIELRKFFLP